LKRRFKIGIDFHTWDGIYQGSRSHILGVYRCAIRQAPDIDFVFFLNDTESLRKAYPEFSSPNVKLVHAGHRPSLLRLLIQLPRLSWLHGLDILHTQYRVPPWVGCKTACTIHDLLCESHPQFFGKFFLLHSRPAFRMAARRADVLFSVSNYSRQEVINRYQVGCGQVDVTYNGVDLERFHPGSDGVEAVKQLGLTPGNYILTVGRLEPRKNQGSLLRAWTQLGPDAPQLVIVGQRDFAFDDVYQAQREAPRKAVLLESVSDEQLLAVMRHASLFAYPAFAEGFGMPVLEAMASGVPVVTSNTTALPEVAGGAAVLVDPDSIDSIAQGLKKGLADAAQRQIMIDKGLAQAARFSWDQSAQVLIKAFKRTLNAP
jgi:glycosyltransferase involved in cell wall biosynthesis